jgi:cell division transport system permease protein
MKVWLSHHSSALVQALRRLAGAPLGSMLSITVIGVAFSLPAGIYVLLQNLNTIGGHVSGIPKMSLFLKLDANQDEVAQIESSLSRHPGIASFEFVSKETALARFTQESGLADIAGSLEKNPLPDAFVVSAASHSAQRLEELEAEILKWPAIEHVQLDSAWAERLEALLKLGLIAALILAGLLSFALVAITFNTIRLQILTRWDEIEVSKLIGATNGFIRRPFLYFGAIQGMAGGVAAWLIIFLAIFLLDDELRHLMQLYEVDFRLHHLSRTDSASLLGFSACLGWIGAWLSVSSHIRQIEPR